MAGFRPAARTDGVPTVLQNSAGVRVNMRFLEFISSGRSEGSGRHPPIRPGANDPGGEAAVQGAGGGGTDDVSCSGGGADFLRRLRQRNARTKATVIAIRPYVGAPA